MLDVCWEDSSFLGSSGMKRGDPLRSLTITTERMPARMRAATARTMMMTSSTAVSLLLDSARHLGSSLRKRKVRGDMMPLGQEGTGDAVSAARAMAQSQWGGPRRVCTACRPELTRRKERGRASCQDQLLVHPDKLTKELLTKKAQGMAAKGKSRLLQDEHGQTTTGGKMPPREQEMHSSQLPSHKITKPIPVNSVRNRSAGPSATWRCSGSA